MWTKLPLCPHFYNGICNDKYYNSYVIEAGRYTSGSRYNTVKYDILLREEHSRVPL